MAACSRNEGIVVAVDGSPSSKVATDWAARDAALRHVPLTLVHVLAQPAMGMWPQPQLAHEFWNHRDEHGHQILADSRHVADRAILDFDPIAVEEKSYSGATIPWPTKTTSPDTFTSGCCTPLNATTSSKYLNGAP